MELEHFFQQSNLFTLLQIVFVGSLLVPGTIGRHDIYRSFLRAAASAVVTYGPITLLVYILYEVSRLS